MLVRQSIIYALGDVTQALLAMGLIALFTHVMSQDEFGRYAFVLTNVQFGYLLAINWMCTSLVRMYHKATDRKALLGAFLGLFGIVTAVGLLVTLGMLPFLESAELKQLALLGYLFFVAMAWMELNMRLFQARLEAGRQARARVTRSLVSAVLGGGLAWYGWGANGAIIGAIVGTAGVGLVQSVREWSGVPLGGDSVVRARLRSYGMPLLISFAIGAASNFVGRYVVVAVGGAAMLGIYVLSAELATRASNLSLNPIGSATSSIAYKDVESSDHVTLNQRLRQACILLFGIALPGAAGLAVVAPDVAATLIGPEFRDGTITILPFVGVATFAAAFRRNYLDQAFHLGLKTDQFIWISVVTLATSLATNFWLILQFGLVGAAYAAVLTVFFELLIVFMIGRKAFKLPFPLPDMAKIAVASSIMAACVAAVPLEPGPVALIGKVLTGCAVYGALIMLLDIGSARRFLRVYILQVSGRQA